MKPFAPLGLALVLLAAPALASDPLGSNAGGPLEDRATESSSQVPKSPEHHGAFVRAALGPGLFWAANKSWSASGDRRVFHGGTASFELAVGGTTRAGFINLGGAYFRDQVFALSSKDSIVDGDEPDLTGYGMTLHSLGLFADVYFGRESGTHVQALLGHGWLSVHNPSGRDRDNPGGTLVQIGFGHEFWLGEDLLLGPLLTVNYGRLSVDETGQSVNLRTLVPALLCSGTIN